MTSRGPQPPIPFSEIELDGIRFRIPRGWEGRIRRQFATRGETTHPVVHAATVPLPPERGDFGSNVVETLGPRDVFVSLVEYGEEAVGTALFPTMDDFPRHLDISSFRTNQLQRLIPGQGGLQRFFTLRGRAFCLFVVLGSMAMRGQLGEEVDALLEGIYVIDPETSSHIR